MLSEALTTLPAFFAFLDEPAMLPEAPPASDEAAEPSVALFGTLPFL